MEKIPKVKLDVLAKSKHYRVWMTEYGIFLRDFTHPDHKELGDARSPDLFLNNLTILELIKVLNKAYDEFAEKASIESEITRAQDDIKNAYILFKQQKSVKEISEALKIPVADVPSYIRMGEKFLKKSKNTGKKI